MRPQRNAAENQRIGGDYRCVLRASMRPQRNAAENDLIGGAAARGHGGFNEAAA